MRKPLNSIVIVLVTIAVIVLGIPFAMGFWIKSHYAKLLNELSTTPNVSTQIMSYDRGWFSSTASVKVTIKFTSGTVNNIQPGGPMQQSFVINEVIKHGPVIMDNGSVVFARAVMHNSLNSSPNKLTSRTVWEIGGLLRGTFSGDKLYFGDKEEGININGIKGTWTFSPNEKFTSKATMASLDVTMKGPNGSASKLVELSNLSADTDINKQGAIWYGYRNVTMGKITVNIPGGTPVVINNIALRGEAKPLGDKLNATMSYNMGTVTAPEFNLKKAVFNMSLNNLDAIALEKVIVEAEKLSKQTKVSQQQAMAMMKPMMELLGKGFTFNLDKLHLATDQGDIDAKGFVTIPPQAKATMQSIMTNMNGKFNLVMPRSWLHAQIVKYYQKRQKRNLDMEATPDELAKLRIDNLVQNAKFVTDGDNLTAEVTIDGMKVLINGKPPQYNPYPFEKPKVKKAEPEPQPTVPQQVDPNAQHDSDAMWDQSGEQLVDQ